MINEFKGQYRFLSNFWYVDILYNGTIFPTTEHFFQAMKTTDKSIRLSISKLPYPAQTKKMGRTIDLRPDWDKIKLDVMRYAIHAKFEDQTLRLQLAQTCPHELVEGNYWHDTYWGIALNTGQGQNHLGKILMAERDSILCTGGGLYA